MPDLTLQTPIQELKNKGRFDSMDRAEITMYIEDIFGFDIWGIDMSGFTNFQYIMDYVSDKTAKHA